MNSNDIHNNHFRSICTEFQFRSVFSRNNLTTPQNNGYDKKIRQLNQKDVPSLNVLHPLCSSILV